MDATREADIRTATGTAPLLEDMADPPTTITLAANMLMGRHQWLSRSAAPYILHFLSLIAPTRSIGIAARVLPQVGHILQSAGQVLSANA